MCKIKYHPLIDPHAKAFANIVAGILGWRLITIQEFERLIAQKGGNDRVALASDILKTNKKNITFSFSNSVKPLVTGEILHHRYLSNLAQQLLGHCWEILRQNKLVPQYNNPIIEFYRHIRNGCFHGNKFNFTRGHLNHVAEWRGLQISKKLQGKKIFRDNLNDKDYFLNWGDTLLLLSDVSVIIK